MILQIIFVIILILISSYLFFIVMKKEHFTIDQIENTISCDRSTKKIETNTLDFPCSRYLAKRGWYDYLASNNNLTPGENLKNVVMTKYLRTPITPINLPDSSQSIASYYDGCMIMNEDLNIFNIDNQCNLKDDKTDIQLLKKNEGCFIDLSCNGKSREEFKYILDNLSSKLSLINQNKIDEQYNQIRSLNNNLNVTKKDLNSCNNTVDDLNNNISNLQNRIRYVIGLVPTFYYTVDKHEIYANSMSSRDRVSPTTKDIWIVPQPGLKLISYQELNLLSNKDVGYPYMSITFWLNIFNPEGNTGEKHILSLSGATSKRPQVFLKSRSSTLCVRYDAAEYIVDKLDTFSMVGIIFSKTKITFFINNDRFVEYPFKGFSIPEEESKLYLSESRIGSYGNIGIKYLKFYDTALTQDMFLYHFDTELKQLGNRVQLKPWIPPVASQQGGGINTGEYVFTFNSLPPGEWITIPNIKFQDIDISNKDMCGITDNGDIKCTAFDARNPGDWIDRPINKNNVRIPYNGNPNLVRGGRTKKKSRRRAIQYVKQSISNPNATFKFKSIALDRNGKLACAINLNNQVWCTENFRNINLTWFPLFDSYGKRFIKQKESKQLSISNNLICSTGLDNKTCCVTYKPDKNKIEQDWNCNKGHAHDISIIEAKRIEPKKPRAIACIIDKKKKLLCTNNIYGGNQGRVTWNVLPMTQDMYKNNATFDQIAMDNNRLCARSGNRITCTPFTTRENARDRYMPIWDNDWIDPMKDNPYTGDIIKFSMDKGNAAIIDRDGTLKTMAGFAKL